MFANKAGVPCICSTEEVCALPFENCITLEAKLPNEKAKKMRVDPCKIYIQKIKGKRCTDRGPQHR